MRNTIKPLVMVFVAVFCLLTCACSPDKGQTEVKDTSSPQQKVRIVSTIYPAYDWVNQITGKNPHIQSSLLIANGIDLHSYQPTAEDIANIVQSDIVITVGDPSDKWVKDVIHKIPGKKPSLVALMDIPGITLLKEEPVDGHSHQKDHAHHHHHDDGDEHDEHVWLSLDNAITSVKAITQQIAQKDKSFAKDYDSNASAYIEKLKALDNNYRNAIAKSPNKTLVIADRFPFRYLVDAYGLTAIAAFDGCSTETRASFETFRRLAAALDRHALDAVVILENTDGKIAKSVLAASNRPDRKTLVMNAMQSVHPEQQQGYLEIMQENLKVLIQALEQMPQPSK